MTASRSDRVWFWAHVGYAIALAVAIVVLIGIGIQEQSALFMNIHQPIVAFLVAPGALLSWIVNSIILAVRRPRVVRTADRVVTVILAVLTTATVLTALDAFTGLVFAIVLVPLLVVGAIVTTIVMGVSSARIRTDATAGRATDATLDALYGASTPPPASPTAPTSAPTPYGPARD